ncbi:MAG: STAS domain-containing protein [Vulcanimicrobiaceae bacterium]
MSLGPADTTYITRESTGNGLCTVVVKGEIDLYNAALLEEALTEACNSGSAVIVDFRKCRYIDSATVAILLRCRKKTGNPVHILTSETGTVRRVLGITQLDSLFIVTSGSDRIAS